MAVDTRPPVLFDATTRKHVPLASGDTIAGNKIQISLDPNNGLTLGVDGGLKVVLTAAMADDQVFTGDNSGSVAITLTPSPNPGDPTQIDYTIKGNVNIAAAQPAGANQIVLVGNALYVPPIITVGSAPAPITTDDGTTPTIFFGGNNSALGAPDGWMIVEIPGVGPRKVPYYA